MIDQPAGWKTCAIADLLEHTIGGVWGSPSGEDEVDVDVFRVTEFGPYGVLNPGTAARRSISKRQLLSRELRDGDVLLEKSGGGPTTPVGRAVGVVKPRREAVPTNFVQLLRPRSELAPRFLLWLLVWEYSRGTTEQFQRATTNIRNLQTKDYLDHVVALPPVGEQERIVAAIEENFSGLDAADRSIKQALRRLGQLSRSIIIDAVPTDGSNGWKVVPVAEAGQTDLGRQRSPKYHRGENMRPYLRVANVFEDRIDDTDVMEMDFDDEAWERSRLTPGDVLLNEGQSPHLVGRPAMYRGNPPEVAFTNSLIRFRSGEGVDPEWALLVFRRHLHSRRFMKEARITTNIGHLALNRFRTVEFPVPDMDEQRQIVSAVTTALDYLDRLRAGVVAAEKRSAALRRSILAAAFSGQLVDQDPADEPASALLERIQEAASAEKSDRQKKHV